MACTIINRDNISECVKVLVAGDLSEKSPLPDIFHDVRFDLHIAARLEDAPKVASRLEPDLVYIVDNGSGNAARETCKSIRDLALNTRPYIVALSSNSDDDFIANTLNDGADDYILEPIPKTRLIARVNAQLRLHDYCGNLLRDKKNSEAVLGMVKAASSTLNASNVLYSIVSNLAEITKAKRCSILLVSDTDTGHVLATSETSEVTEISIDLHKYPEIKEAIRTRDVLIVSDMPNHPLMAEISGLLSGFEGMSVLVAPIIFGEKVLGTLLLRAHKTNFNEKEIELCRSTANACYPALKNARLYEKLKEEKEKLLYEQIQTLAKSRSELVAVNETLNKEMVERRRAEESIRTQAQLIRSIIDNSTAVICVKDTDGRYLLANQAFLDTFRTDIDTVTGNTDFALFPVDMASAFRANDIKVQEALTPLEFEETAIIEDVPHTYISVKFPLYNASGVVYAVCGISTDITARKHLENEHLKVQKLESIGVLAGGIAHDFNNILTGILANISILSDCADNDEKITRRLIEVEKATLRAKELTNQLLTFSKGGKPIKEVFDAGAIVRECGDFSTRGSNVKCLYDIEENLAPVEADIGQISQVINNLAINAKQAMPEGGILKISARNVNNASKKTTPMDIGRYTKISIEDQGTGISTEDLSKIFDPYFTTKKEGSGLGLSSVYSIVKNHDGFIDVTSTPGNGTTFDIYLPASDKKVTRKTDEASQLFTGTGRILVMDDEKMIRDVMDSILSVLGYKTHFALNGEEALQSYKQAEEAGEPFDAVIMDLTIRGGLGGKETIKKILEYNPAAKVIVSSGYHNDPIMSDHRRHGFKDIILKPYRAAELSRVLKKVLLS